MAPPRLRVGVIGTGRAGSVIGAALHRVGHEVVAVAAVSEISRLRAQALLPQAPVVDVADVAAASDLVLVAVPDDVLEGLLAGLAASGVVKPGQFWVHLSGRYGTEVMAPVAAEGALPLAIHPVMSFTGTSMDLMRLEECPFGVTAPDELRSAAEALVIEIGGDPIWVPEDKRVLYHAALAFGSNYLITLVAQSADLLAAAGIEEPRRVLAPLLGASLDNALRLGDQALTGPVARGDAATVEAHLAVLKNQSELAAASYRALARVTADRAVDAGLLSAALAEALLGVLSEGGESV
ncbi:unannotated protein [freshwater metagenome]|uniref:Unannotated protein n=1 Tax=freshwater metagenome TaxID=449393 RepID=A0A6J6IN10_9ZZZZ|nr:DUF2520 domain-containing protein [Actinomycetota bacterium]MSZ41764.1 DUF2520 domain-containing protein [Actinomycetota bacterium]